MSIELNSQQAAQVAGAREMITVSFNWLMTEIEKDGGMHKQFDLIHRMRHSLRDQAAIISKLTSAT